MDLKQTNAQEADFEVKTRLAPQKASKNCKKRDFRSNFFQNFFISVFRRFLGRQGSQEAENWMGERSRCPGKVFLLMFEAKNRKNREKS